jgi:hypothetical protein
MPFDVGSEITVKLPTGSTYTGIIYHSDAAILVLSDTTSDAWHILKAPGLKVISPRKVPGEVPMLPILTMEVIRERERGMLLYCLTL